ncbi:MAG: hypothetical protein Q8S24_01175 [Eubacteriales bacterium]|nr:hypothetical protein [Eubacteriales bacterium]
MKPNDIDWGMFPDRGTFGIGRMIRIKDKFIQVLFQSEKDANRIMSPFRHLETDSDMIGESSLRIYVFQNIEPGNDFPVWESLNRWASEGEKLQMYNRETRHILYNDESKVLTAIDTQSAEAYYYMPCLDSMPYYEKAAPMRMIFHHWAQSNGMLLIHGACIGLGGKGLLLAGKGGTGKSTTAISAALAGFDFLGDDYLLADPTDRTIHSLYGSSKIRWDATQILPVAGTLTVNRREEDEKGIFFLKDVESCRLSKSLMLGAVILPKIGGGQLSTYNRTTMTEGLMPLASSTIFQMPGSGKETLNAISSLLKGIPVFRMSLSQDTDEINSKLREIISNL